MLSVTTIIAHYNYNHFLKSALESCINQTYNNFICVIDDGSKEPPIDILSGLFGQPRQEDNKLLFKDRAALLFTEGRKGPSYARNIGIKEFKSDAYMILDADDYMMPNKIEKMAKVMEDPNIGVVYADYIIDNLENGTMTMEYKHPYDLFMLENDCIVHSGAMISAKFLDKIKFSENEWYRNDLRVAEDYNLWLRLSKVCMFYHIPEFLTVVKNHSQNSTNTVNKEIWYNNLLKAKQ